MTADRLGPEPLPGRTASTGIAAGTSRVPQDRNLDLLPLITTSRTMVSRPADRRSKREVDDFAGEKRSCSQIRDSRPAARHTSHHVISVLSQGRPRGEILRKDSPRHHRCANLMPGTAVVIGLMAAVPLETVWNGRQLLPGNWICFARPVCLWPSMTGILNLSVNDWKTCCIRRHSNV